MRFRSSALVCLMIVSTLAGCGSPEEPFGVVTASPDRVDLGHSSWTRIGLYWRMNAPIEGVQGELRVGLHLLDGKDELVRTFDHPYPGPWSVGETRTYAVEIFQSALAEPLPEGEYRLAATLYDTAGGRWPVATEDDSRALATVAAGGPVANTPEVYFSAEWLPIEEGTDRQIVARRWLTGDGAIRVGSLTREGSLWLRVGIPEGSERQELTLDEGAGEQVASITAECSGFEAQLTGSGSHTLEIPLAPDRETADCEIAFSANFVLVSLENQETRTVALENLAWRQD